MSSFLSRPLFALTRHATPELMVHGSYAIKRYGEECRGDEEFSFFAGSLLSPWQCLASEINQTDPWWSLGVAWHSGQDIHLEALGHLSAYAQAGEEDLICPREYPLDGERAAQLRFTQRKPLRLHHPCSGKHLLMLAACQKFGYQKDLYWEVDHPLQKRIFNLVGREAGEQVRWAKDTCGMPSFYMPLRVHLGMWERFALDEGDKAVVLKTLWLQNPRLVGGLGRLDSDLTLAANSKVLAKESGNGDLLLQFLGDQHHAPASCFIKIASGPSKVYSALALLVVIRQHPELPPIFHEIAEYLHSRLDEWLPREFTLQELH